MYKAVQEDRKAHPGESIFEQVLRGTDATGEVLILDGTVLSFEKGSRAKRYLRWWPAFPARGFIACPRVRVLGGRARDPRSA